MDIFILESSVDVLLLLLEVGGGGDDVIMMDRWIDEWMYGLMDGWME